MAITSSDLTAEVTRLGHVERELVAQKVKYTTLLAAAEPVADALIEYGHHPPVCDAGLYPWTAPCTCGLAAALKQGDVVLALRGAS